MYTYICKKASMKNIIVILFILIISGVSYANIIIVSATGSGEYNSIQEGINASVSGDTVLVMPGVYFEYIDFTGKDIVVASNYLLSGDTSIINQTVINGNHQNSRLVRFCGGETHAARLIGFTITNAFDDTPAATPPVIGLGIYINNSSPTIEHNKIRDNEFGGWYSCGGGIVAKNSSAIIRYNDVIRNNYAFWGGGIYLDSCSNVVIDNNYIAQQFLTSGYGVAEGGGIYILQSNNITIKNNLIEENYLDYGNGAAITAWACADLLLTNNILCNNRSSNYKSELHFLGAQGKMIGNLMYNNKYLNNRVRIELEGSQLDVINSTIISNNHYAIKCSNSTLNVFNSVLNNPADTVAGSQIILDNSILLIENSNLESDTAGVIFNSSSSCSFTDLISSDPMFSGLAGSPYSLSFYSPCIDKGSVDTTGFNLPVFDLAGEPRIENGRIDMGAYEYPYYLSVNKPVRNLVFTIIPNPVKNSFTILTDDYIKGELSYCVFNIHGQVVMKGSIQTDTQIQSNNLKPGIYFIEITQNHEKGMQRLVKL